MYEDMPEDRINKFYEKLKKDAEAGGYQLNLTQILLKTC